MSDYIILTDSTSDLPLDYYKEHEVEFSSLNYRINDVSYGGKNGEMDYKEFYELMRGGMMPTTSLINPQEHKEKFQELLKKNKNILYLAFSSGLSGTYNNARIAAEEVMEEEDCNIIVVDTLGASLGEGLMVHKAVELRDKGASMEEVAAWMEEHKQNFTMVFTVDDLFHLYRGGRVSKTSAVVGSLISIKPKLHVDAEGHLILIDKVRGRKKSLQELVNYMDEKVGEYRDEKQTVFISHADAEEDALFVKKMIEERFGYEDFLIAPIGPTIGAHAGPGTIALFFMGKER